MGIDAQYRAELLAAAKEGAMLQHIHDSEVLPPDVAREELMTFTVGIGSPQGLPLIPAPVPVSCRGDFDFMIRGLRAWIENPADNPANFSLITFNFQEVGKWTNWFSRPVNAASLIGPAGPAGDLMFEVGRRAEGGSTILLLVNQAAGWAGRNKVFGVTLIGDLVRKGIK